MTISLLPLDERKVRVLPGDVSGTMGTQLVVPLEPGEAYDEIPYAVWLTYSGEIARIEDVRHWGPLPATARKETLAGERIVCPRCGSAMVEGAVRLRTTLVGLLVAGLSYMHLFFTPAGGKRELVLRYGTEAIAFRCPQCHATLVQ